MTPTAVRGVLLWIAFVALSPPVVALTDGEFTWRVVVASCAAILVTAFTLMLVERPRSLSPRAWFAQLHTRFVPRSAPPSNSTEETK